MGSVLSREKKKTRMEREKEQDNRVQDYRTRVFPSSETPDLGYADNSPKRGGEIEAYRITRSLHSNDERDLE
jgi:hypothetical protein